MNFTRTLIFPCLLLALPVLVACGSDDDDGTTNPSAGAGGSSGGAAGMSAGGSTAGTGTAGASTGGSGGSGPPMGSPASDSQADLLTFLKAGTYKNAPWKSATAAPGQSGSHGGTVQVWMNPPLIDSLKNGRTGAMTQPKPDQYSMAVKELLDDAGMVVGRAAIYRSGAAADANSWVYLCYGPSSSRCAVTETVSETMPAYGKGTTGQGCHFCHAPTLQPILSPPPP